MRARRSVLYMPASNLKAIEKARSLPCDAIILDLEDAVAPEAKELARRQAVAAVETGGFGSREVIIRVNGLDTEWGEDDLRAACLAGPDAILAPKVASGAEVKAYASRLENAPGRTWLWCMIETGRALFHLDSIAAASAEARVAAWVMGTNDLVKESGAQLVAGRAPLLAALSLAVVAAKAYELAILDGVFNGLEDDDGLESECRQGQEFGFDGKTLIHPRQIDICNRNFSPTAAQIEDAREIFAAFALPENEGKGAIRLAGRMVERLHLVQAKKVIAVADATRP